MTAQELLQLLKQRPFVPLRLYMTDGKTYDVRHPDLVLVLRQRVDIGIPIAPGEGVLDRVDHCSLLHIVRVEELPAPVPPGDGNGSAG